MNSRAIALAALALGVLISGCSSAAKHSEPATPTSAAAVPVAATAESGSIMSTSGHVPSEAAVSMYVRQLNDILAPEGESMELGEAMSIAASMCDFLDAGNSPYDAVQLFASKGVPESAGAKIVPLAMGAACTQHLPS